jgi:predicted nucleotidyltransferase
VSSLEAWLYGSAARGDADALSDVDVLVITEPGESMDVVELDLPETATPSWYTWPEIEAMVDYGSLFLLHVKAERQPLREEEPPRLRQLLAELPPYARADQELDSFRRVVVDVEESAAGDPSPQFELAVLATAARHAAILGCYLLGSPEFGRCRPFRVLLPRLGYSDAEVGEFERLYDYRVSENSGEARNLGPGDTISEWVPRVRDLIEKVQGLPR